jgi:hypothetical protein
MNRTRDAGRVNDLSGLDLGEAVAEPLHVFLEEGESLGCFVWRGPGVFEFHIQFEVRGRQAIDLLRAMMARMRSDHGARYLWTSIPADKRHVRMFARLVGLSSDGMIDTDQGPHELFYSENAVCP